jgi:primase-polymerase (primpol)-like protein
MNDTNNDLTNNVEEPDWLNPNFSSIPDELKKLPWGIWRAEPRLDKNGYPTGKHHKAPRNPKTGKKISVNKPEDFGTFEEAKQAYESGSCTGVGVLMCDANIVGIDIDDAIEVFEKRPDVEEWAKQAVKEGAYCEVSPSGNGLRLFVNGKLSGKGRKVDKLEIYDDGRFLSVTGHVLSGGES